MEKIFFSPELKPHSENCSELAHFIIPITQSDTHRVVRGWIVSSGRPPSEDLKLVIRGRGMCYLFDSINEELWFSRVKTGRSERYAGSSVAREGSSFVEGGQRVVRARLILWKNIPCRWACSLCVVTALLHRAGLPAWATIAVAAFATTPRN